MQKASTIAVILNWNGADHTLRCTAHVLGQTGAGADVLIVDNGSHDDSVARIRDAKLPVRLLQLERNQGFAGGMNAGLREALAGSYEYAWLLNSDAFAERDCLHRLTERMNRARALAMVTPRLISTDGTEQHAGGMVDWHAGEVTTLRSSELVSPISDRYWLTGTAPLLRVASLPSVGLFEPSFFAYWEDIDLSVRLRRSGGELGAVPDAAVVHLGSSSSGSRSAIVRFLLTRNSWLFLARNAPIDRGRWLRFTSEVFGGVEFLERQGEDSLARAMLAALSAIRRGCYGAPPTSFEPAMFERLTFRQLRRWPLTLSRRLVDWVEPRSLKSTASDTAWSPAGQ